MARDLPALILTAIVSNMAGLFTLVDDPATFLVGSALGMTFGEYLRKVSLGGALSLVALVSVGISAANGRPVSFAGFMRYGVPVVLVQLAASALYVLALHLTLGR